MRCVLQKVFYKIENGEKADNLFIVLQIWCVVLVFECQVSEIVTSKYFLCKQLKNKIVIDIPE